MPSMLLLAAGAYLAGSIPFGLLTARLAGGIDIRSHGSGNIGATNVARVLGPRWGACVLVLDALKGLLPVLLLPILWFDPGDPLFVHARVCAGVATIVGHMFPCWLGFRGGKGVATSLGVVLVLSWPASLAAFAAFALTFLTWRYVSLSSMTASIVFSIAVFCERTDLFSRETWSLAAFSLAVPALIIARHQANIGRLMRGEERKFRFPTNREA